MIKNSSTHTKWIKLITNKIKPVSSINNIIYNIGVHLFFLPIILKHPQESCKKRPSYAEDFGFEIGGNERVNLMQK